MMIASTKVSLILPCFNEMEHLSASLSKISDFMKFLFPSSNYEIILVDDGSTDGTRDTLKAMRNHNFRILLNEKNLGRGGAVKRGMNAATGDIIGFMDIDCEVSEAYLPKFVQEISAGADLAVGNRIYRASPQPYILLRHFLSLGYKFMLMKLMGTQARDTEAGFKFFSRSLVNRIVSKSQFDDWFWDTEVVMLAEMWNCRVKEIPVAFQRNAEKTSTVKVFRDSINYLQNIFRYLKFKRSHLYNLPEWINPKSKAG